MSAVGRLLRAVGVGRGVEAVVAHRPGFVGRMIRAGYDAVATTDANKNHWRHAGVWNRTADEINSPQARMVARSRARYECANNPWADGILQTLANDVVGTGPHLWVPGPGGPVTARKFERWAVAIRLDEKLRTLRMARARDGEVFVRFVTNPGVRNAVQLDLEIIEADRVTHGQLGHNKRVDGIEYDPHGNPEAYMIMPEPDPETGRLNLTPERVPARQVLHYYRPLRPGQGRGMSEMVSSLPTFANLRRWTLAVIAAAEFAAGAMGVVSQEHATDDDETLATGDTFDVEPRTMYTLPPGVKLNQLKAEQPTSTHGEFLAATLNEAARPFCMPRNIAQMDSSGYNYASGRLDHQGYYRFLSVDRQDLERDVCDAVLRAWLLEAVLVEGHLPSEMRSRAGAFRSVGGALGVDEIDHSWLWPGHDHADPAKEANAQQTRLKSGTTTLTREWAIRGVQFESAVAERAYERDVIRRYGMEAEFGVAEENPPAADDPDDDDEGDERDEDARNPKREAADARR